MTVTRPAVWRALAAPAVWLERAKGRRRLALLAVYALVGLGLAAAAYRQSRLAGLPDVGDPFDPAPLLSLAVPDEENAFVLYREATAKLKHDRAVELRIMGGSWAWPATADPEALAFLEANAEALELWRLGSERPDALERPVGDLDVRSALPMVQEHRHFVRLARLHASKAQADGDLEECWRWLRAILRGSRLIGRHGMVIARLVGTAEYNVAVGPVRSWAADRRTSPAQLRRALGDLQTINALTPTVAECLQVEYFSLMKSLDDPEAFWNFLLDDPWSMKVVDGTSWLNHLKPAQRLGLFLQAEPERSRRLLRLTFANGLAHSDDLPAVRPALVGPTPGPTPAAKSALPQSASQAIEAELYDVPPAAGPPPRALADAIRATWLASTLTTPFGQLQKAFDRDRAQRASLVMSLAEELYRRERGKSPESPEALIGTVLDRFPEGYTPPEPESATDGGTP